MWVNFEEIRKHPAAAKFDTVLKGAPAYRAFPTIDPVRDLDWMIWHGEDLTVHYGLTDEAVDKAIERVAGAYDVHVAGVRAWKGHVTYGETAFLRTAPHLVVIVPVEHADLAARELARRAPAAPTFHANEMVRVRLVPPSAAVSGIPEDITDARVWIDSRLSDGGAEIFGEGDCPTEDAAQKDVIALTTFVQQKNTFPVRLMTSGLLNHVEIGRAGTHVRMHIAATAAQIEAVLTAAGSMYGSP